MKTLMMDNWYFPKGFTFDKIPKRTRRTIRTWSWLLCRQNNSDFNMEFKDFSKDRLAEALKSNVIYFPRVTNLDYKEYVYGVYLNFMSFKGTPPLSFDKFWGQDNSLIKVWGKEVFILYHEGKDEIDTKIAFCEPPCEDCSVNSKNYRYILHMWLIERYCGTHSISLGLNSVGSSVSEYKRRYGASHRFHELKYRVFKPLEDGDFPKIRWLLNHMPMWLFKHTWILRGLLGRE